MKYNINLNKEPLPYYKKFIEGCVKYYEKIIDEYKKNSFYLGLFIAKHIQKIINNNTDIDVNEIELLCKALEGNLGKQGTQWDEMFFKFKNWKHNYIDTK